MPLNLIGIDVGLFLGTSPLVQRWQLADPLVNGWEGTALRGRLRRDPASLATMLDFDLSAVAGGGTGAPAGP